MVPFAQSPYVVSCPGPGRRNMAKKDERHRAITELVGSHEISNQEELRQLLVERGWDVTQATLSRDLRELGVVRAPAENGTRYLLPDRLADDVKPNLDNILPHLFSSVDGVGELLVIHTLPSGAQPVAEAIDSQGWPDIIGTIAGENTILIICRSAAAREALAERVRRLARQP